MGTSPDELITDLRALVSTGDHAMATRQARALLADGHDDATVVAAALVVPPAWSSVEAFPAASADLIELLDAARRRTTQPGDHARLSARLAVASYWADRFGVPSPVGAWYARDEVTRRALVAASASGDADVIAEVVIDRLHACWVPGMVAERPTLLAHLDEALQALGAEADPVLTAEAAQWRVLGLLDEGRGHEADRAIAAFVPPGSGPVAAPYRRRAELWRASRAMARGELDRALAENEAAVSSTADLAGAPFAFQNVAVTLAIERYFRGGLHEMIEPIRSVLASSPRVEPNWRTALAFCLAETERDDAAGELFAELVADGCAAIPWDLNWLVTLHLLALTAARLHDPAAAAVLYELLTPYGHLDATHGFGYASYGPMARPLAQLALVLGNDDDARRWCRVVLDTRGAGPWRALTRLDHAAALVGAHPELAQAEALGAAAELQADGLGVWAAAARPIVVAATAAGAAGGVARFDGTSWHFVHGLGEATIGDTIGARQLAQLLRRPGRSLDARDLDLTGAAAMSGAERVDDQASVEPVLDRTAREAYRRRLDELEARDDPTDRTAAEIASLRQALAASRRPARSSSAELERARIRVTKSIRRVIGAIGDQSPRLGTYLADHVSTGRRCSFDPTDGRPWQVYE